MRSNFQPLLQSSCFQEVATAIRSQKIVLITLLSLHSPHLFQHQVHQQDLFAHGFTDGCVKLQLHSYDKMASLQKCHISLKTILL